MRFGSLFTGIGGFDLGLERAGHECVFQCEKDPYRRRVLEHHWPGVPCSTDVRNIGLPFNGRSGLHGTSEREPDSQGGEWVGDQFSPGDIDLLCGGFPCQDLSVAGKRRGLAGERSGLFFEFARIADALLSDGGWVLIENVPGLLSSNSGRDFAVLLSTLAELGFHDLAWRVLDSRYLGVPQRRRRVFILARRSGGRRASEVLLEPESGGGDFEAGGEAREGTAASLTKGSAASRGVSYPGRRREDDENLIARTLKATSNISPSKGADHDTYVTHTLRSEGFDASEDGTGRGTPLVAGSPPHPNGDGAPAGIPGRAHNPVTAFHATQEPITDGEIFPALGAGAYLGHNGRGVERPSCSIDPKPDGPRYAACGDAVTVNVAHWIGLRLAQVGE